jgi:AraC-like DNA-binding protein
MMKPTVKPNKHSVIISFFLSYVMILSVPILFGVSVYIQAEKIIENEINKSNTAILEQSRQALDVGLGDIERLISQITLNNKFRLLMGIEGRGLTNQDYYDVYRAVRDYLYYKAFTGYMDDYFIYLNKIDKILCSSGLLDRRLYFDSCWANTLSYNGITFESWSEIIMGKYSGKYVKLGKTGDATGASVVLYTLQLPVGKTENPDATVVIRLNSKEINETIQNNTEPAERSVVILDKENQVLFSAGPELIPYQSIKYEAFDGHGLTYLTYDHKKYAVSYISSEIAPWIYISIIPYDSFWDKVEFIRVITVIGAGFCLILGMIVSYLFARRNYTPIKGLMSILGKREGIDSRKHNNEYKFIQEAVMDTINENETINKRLLIQNQVLLSNFIAKLLQGRLDDAVYIEKTLQAFGIHFRSACFMVILFYLDHSANPADCGAVEPTTMEHVNGILSTVSNILQQAGDGECINHVYTTELDAMPAFLVNLKHASGRPAILQAVCEAVNAIQTNLAMPVWSSASGVHETYPGIARAYQEALDAMEYNIISYPGATNPVILYEDVRDLDGKYDYSLEVEGRLINCIKAGDSDSGKRLLDEIFQVNFMSRHLSGKAIKSLMLDLNNTVLKALSETCAELGEINIINRLLKSDKLQEMKSDLYKILRDACDKAKHSARNRHSQFVEEVMAYIRQNYGDKNLCLTTIGKRFCMNAEYIARLFKEETGESLNDYLGGIRIEKAKNMLSEDRLSIKAIADSTGYFSSNVFIRAFKRREGITPGMYKRISGSKLHTFV